MANASGKKASTSWVSSSLAGKALGVFGGGAVHRKLRSIRFIFPHDDDTTIANIWDIYADALEYLSPGTQSSDSVKDTIAKLFLTQIRLEQTFHLTHTLRGLSSLENQHVLSAIMTTCMNDIEKLCDTQYRESGNTTLAITTNEAKTLVPVLRFIIRSAMRSDRACRTALDAGILYMILRICTIFPSFSRSAMDAPEHWSPLRKACRSTLVALSRSETNYDAVLQHPVCIMWMDCHPHPPPYSIEEPNPLNSIPARCVMWRKVDRRCVERRLMTIVADPHCQSNVYDIENIEACADIVEFSQPQYYDSETVDLAFLAMLKHILLDGDSAGHLINTLAERTIESAVCIFSGILRLWLECVQMQMQNEIAYGVSSQGGAFVFKSREGRISPVTPLDSDKDFYGREKTRLFERVSKVDATMYKIIKFAIDAARKSSTMRCAILNAGGLSLVIVAFVNEDFLPSNLMDVGRKKRKQKEGKSTGTTTVDAPSSVPLDVIHDEAAVLSVLMHDTAFQRSWTQKQFNSRRHICSILIGVLLGEFGDRDDRYTWTRALFRKIVALPRGSGGS